MFLEPHLGKFPHNERKFSGWIEVICGAMFSGKTEELIRRLKRAVLASQKVEIFKPAFDTRYHREKIVSHNANKIKCTPVHSATDLLLRSADFDVIGIDEAQFFDDKLVEVCDQLANDGKRVIVAGLDMDFSGKPFDPMPQLIAAAEFITKLHAVCMVCGSIASYSYRLNDVKEKVLLGEKAHYEARCRRCFHKGIKTNKP